MFLIFKTVKKNSESSLLNVNTNPKKRGRPRKQTTSKENEKKQKLTDTKIAAKSLPKLEQSNEIEIIGDNYTEANIIPPIELVLIKHDQEWLSNLHIERFSNIISSQFREVAGLFNPTVFLDTA